MIKINNIKNLKEENICNLEDTYSYVYICHICKTKYGSDKKELDIKPHLCPICEKQ